MSPGPCGYKIPDINCYKQRAPRYTIVSRRYTKYASPLDDEYDI